MPVGEKGPVSKGEAVGEQPHAQQRKVSSEKQEGRILCVLVAMGCIGSGLSAKPHRIRRVEYKEPGMSGNCRPSQLCLFLAWAEVRAWVVHFGWKREPRDPTAEFCGCGHGSKEKLRTGDFFTQH